MKSIALAMIIVGASSAIAFAQGTGPAGTDAGPGGVTGTTRTKDVGSNTPNVGQARDGASSSSSMEMQRQKANNDAGVPQSTNSNQK